MLENGFREKFAFGYADLEVLASHPRGFEVSGFAYVVLGPRGANLS